MIGRHGERLPVATDGLREALEPIFEQPPTLDQQIGAVAWICGRRQRRRCPGEHRLELVPALGAREQSAQDPERPHRRSVGLERRTGGGERRRRRSSRLLDAHAALAQPRHLAEEGPAPPPLGGGYLRFVHANVARGSSSAASTMGGCSSTASGELQEVDRRGRQRARIAVRLGLPGLGDDLGRHRPGALRGLDRRGTGGGPSISTSISTSSSSSPSGPGGMPRVPHAHYRGAWIGMSMDRPP